MSRNPFERLLWAVYARLYDRLWDNRLTDRLAARVVGLLSSGLPVDEVGAGTGLYTQHLHRAGMEVRASEPDPRMRRQLVARLPGLDISDSAIEDLGDDVPEPRAVLAANVLHLVSEPGAALESLRRRAGRDGVVIVVGPTSRASLTRLCLALRRCGESTPGVLRFLAIHIALGPLVALGGGLEVGRRSARVADGAALHEAVAGVAQVAVFGDCPRGDPRR